MDDLDSNPLYRAFQSEFRRTYEMACERSYLIVIPTSESLEDLAINESIANSHILMPSRLLKMHYNSVQAGCSQDIEIDNKKLLCHLDKGIKEYDILFEDTAYNTRGNEFKTIIIDRPLPAPTDKTIIKSILSLGSNTVAYKRRTPRPLRDHNECLKYLESISQKITVEFESAIEQLRSNYMILPKYLDETAERIQSLANFYIDEYENNLLLETCGSWTRFIRVAVETYAVQRLHRDLISAIKCKYLIHEQKLSSKLEAMHLSELNICDLGARPSFAHFTIRQELAYELNKLPEIQNPLAALSILRRVFQLITESLTTSVRFNNIIKESFSPMTSTPICSEDLIASLIYALVKVKPKSMYSISKYLELFCWSAASRDQAAYDVITFHIAVNYLHDQPDGLA